MTQGLQPPDAAAAEGWASRPEAPPGLKFCKNSEDTGKWSPYADIQSFRSVTISLKLYYLKFLLKQVPV